MVSIVRAVEGVEGIPAGFPILLDRDMAIVESALRYLLDLAVVPGRSHAADTLRTYAEHLYDWFDTLEQSLLDWRTANEGTRDDCRLPEQNAFGAEPAYWQTLCAVDHQRSCPNDLPFLRLGAPPSVDRRTALRLCRRVGTVVSSPRHAGAFGSTAGDRIRQRADDRGG